MPGALGKDYDSRLLSREVRDLALEEIRGILKGEVKVEKRFREALILKLAGTVLPKLNELSGENGEPIQVSVVNYANRDNNPAPVQSEDISIRVPTGNPSV